MSLNKSQILFEIKDHLNKLTYNEIQLILSETKFIFNAKLENSLCITFNNGLKLLIENNSASRKLWFYNSTFYKNYEDFLSKNIVKKHIKCNELLKLRLILSLFLFFSFGIVSIVLTNFILMLITMCFLLICIYTGLLLDYHERR